MMYCTAWLLHARNCRYRFQQYQQQKKQKKKRLSVECQEKWLARLRICDRDEILLH